MKFLLVILMLALNQNSFGQILPDSKHAFKSVMRIKKTNLCFLLSKSENSKDLLSFSFRDFIYDYKKVPETNVKLEVIKILKNYKSCNGHGGLKMKFSIDGEVFDEKNTVPMQSSLSRRIQFMNASEFMKRPRRAVPT